MLFNSFDFVFVLHRQRAHDGSARSAGGISPGVEIGSDSLALQKPSLMITRQQAKTVFRAQKLQACPIFSFACRL
jgi:hypothetical protein